MFGHDWQKATGTVAWLRITATTNSPYGNDIRHEYEVDVQPGGQPARRVTVADPHVMTADWMAPQKGDEVTLVRRAGHLILTVAGLRGF